MAGQTKVKTLTHAIFKGRTNPVPATIWPQLMVRSEGQEVTNLLEEWGATDIQAHPVISLLISARETTGRITSSKTVIRGPIFTASEENPIKANAIWPGLDEDLTLRFSISGETLNFSNREARNLSVWQALDSLTSFKVYKGDDLVSRDDYKDIDGLREGVSFRVATYTHSIKHMATSLLIAPKPLNMIRTKARDWNIPHESNQFPAIDITSHWTRYGPVHLTVSRLPGQQTNPSLSLQE